MAFNHNTSISTVSVSHLFIRKRRDISTEEGSRVAVKRYLRPENRANTKHVYKHTLGV